MNYLVGDIGNTLTKICLLNSKFKIVKSHSVKTQKLNIKKYKINFFEKFRFSSINRHVLFSSVVPSVFKIIKLHLNKNKFKTIEIKELKLKEIIKLNVDSFNQVGSDRIANAIGAYDTYKKNCLVIDFGTATTFDVIKWPGLYDGGVIAPGINSSIVNLNKSTALLPILSLNSKTKTYGKNTKDALNAGFLWGYQGLINNIIKKIRLSSKTNYKVILTGGKANLFKNYINNKPTVDDNITIKGIIKIYKNLLI